MTELLKNLNEHSALIILILGTFSVWSLKRILGKIESNQEDLAEALKATDRQNETRISEVYDHVNNLRRERDGQFNGLNTRLSSLEGEHKARHGRKP